MNEIEILRELDNLYEKLEKKSDTFLGYPCVAKLSELEIFSRFLKFHINNIGNPMTEGSLGLNTKECERKILQFFADLYNIDNYFGYLPNGGTEGNLWGMLIGRGCLREQTGKEPIVYSSKDTHYSVIKNTWILNLKFVEIKSQINGEIDYEDLESKLDTNNPAIIVGNVGTTFKGAIDNIPRIEKILKKLKIKYYIHADAALGGMMLPFLNDSPIFDFRTDVGSISVSGHKALGSTIPIGIVLARKEYANMIGLPIEYIRDMDITISGSRDGLSPLFLYYYIKKFGIEGFKNVTEECIKKADYLIEELNKINYNAWRNEFSNIVIFKKPSQKIIEKWQLATQFNVAHVVIMRSISKEQIDNFIRDLKNSITIK